MAVMIRECRGDVMERQGRTEATVDLMHLAGLKPCCALCERTKTDETIARLPKGMAYLC